MPKEEVRQLSFSELDYLSMHPERKLEDYPYDVPKDIKKEEEPQLPL